MALMYLGREAEARASFERAAELSPSDPHPLLNLGILGERSGHRDEAERAFQAALDRDPSSEDALERLLALRAG
ncbi:MAG: tetratricopeptide repeat protein [Sandaracinaceae bacterium]|nr:tetratricopeptide repeat protein [Sandaracinaceae bacterium]